MLFMQPVVVNDAHAMDRATAAEVRLAQPSAAQAEEQPSWSSWADTMLAQAGMDSRSPFGPNAVDHNDLTPPPSAPHQPGDTVAPPAAPSAAKPADSPNQPAQAPGQTDAAPPGASGTTTATPETPPSTATPATVPSTATPGAPAPVTTPGAGSTSGTTPPDATTPPGTPYKASSSTSPGTTEFTRPAGSSGASNTE